MKSPIRFTLLVLAGVVLTASGIILARNGSSQETETREVLNVLNWTSYIPDGIISDFEKETGIKVNYGTYSSNEELLAKVSSAASGTYDVIFPSDYMVDLLIFRDMLEPLDHSRLTNEKNLNSAFLNQTYDEENRYSLPFLLATSVIVYDSEKLDRITSYSDLLRPELENNLVLIDDQRIIIGAMLNAEGFDMNDTRDSSLEKSLEFFNKLRPNIKAFDSDSPKTFLITGEVDAGLIWNAEATLATELRDGLKIVYPSEGFALSMDNYCIMKNSKNLDAAYELIDFLLRDDISARIVEEYPYISPNSRANTLSDEELEEILSRGTYVKNVGSDIKKFDRLWSKYK